jgi:ribosomal protein S18 acetylase RimI-like enzyme
MINAIAIAPFSEDHLGAVARLHNETTRYMAEIAAAGFGASLLPVPGADETAELFRCSACDPDNILRIALIEDEFAGFCLGAIETHGDDLVAAPFLTIQFLAVCKARQGSGVGAALIRDMEACAAQRGIHTIDILVWENNTGARKLYSKLGYIPLKIRLAKRLDHGQGASPPAS